MDLVLSPEILAMLFAAAAVAGFVDAIAGGGGTKARVVVAGLT